MKILFAQGNPGQDYSTTRHNVGFMALDTLAKAHSASFSHKSKFDADIAEVSISGEKVLLVKPRTFYNETGKSARAICDFYKCAPATDLLAIHDDLALPLGTIRTRQQGSDAGNNGIKSLNSHLGGVFWRLRIGIYSTLKDRINDATFVLANFQKAEMNILKDGIIPKTLELAAQFCSEELEASSHRI